MGVFFRQLYGSWLCEQGIRSAVPDDNSHPSSHVSFDYIKKNGPRNLSC